MITAEYMEEIRQAIDSSVWVEVHDPAINERGARAWNGSGGAWTILVTAWPTNGGWGFDGTASQIGTIVRLTRDLAERAALRAATRGLA